MKTASRFPVAITEPSLPKGGGAIQGMSASLSQVGPSGMASMSLALPISGGRGYAPSLVLGYSSGAGNGAFGIGWALNPLAIARRTSHGVPQYGSDDQFVGPDGEVLEPERDATGMIVTTQVTEYNSRKLDDTYEVTRYFPRVEGGFDRIERWLGSQGAEHDFWMIHGADGQLHCLGKTTGARISDPAAPAHIAVWLIEESVAPEGHHIWYRYEAENTSGVDTSGNEAQRDHQAGRYLAEVSYGNVKAFADLFLFDGNGPQNQDWLFSVVFDYGERGTDPTTAPAYEPASGNTWPARADAFSHYCYGFEVRHHRLCRQVLMFHHFPDELGEPDTLVARLLLEYDERSVLSVLASASQWAYETDGTVQSLPPVEFGYTAFQVSQEPVWQVFNPFLGLDDGYPYQFVDLRGEGIAGALYRAAGLWYYRAPQRDGKLGENTVSYGEWQALPSVPAMQPQRMSLMDIDGDGRLEWLVTQPGIAGFFPLNPDETSPDSRGAAFTPFNALPCEFFHPQAHLIDLAGAGLSDLALIGPKSVRLYVNLRDGFAAGIDIDQTSELPVAGRDAREMVAFSDMLGAGQQQLVRVRNDGVTVWPNLGRGRFGEPIQLTLNIEASAFDPERIYLADLDGSGAADVIFVTSDSIRIYFNNSGNSLSRGPDLPLPGIRFDRLCRLSIVDLQGNGTASLLLTQTDVTTRHWRYDFVVSKPYLLNRIDNNMGASTALVYRSSAQEWLDEKRECEAAESAAASHLPFPLHVVSTVTNTDEITGNVLSQSYLYRRGMYDGREREFRGFGYVQTLDTNQACSSNGGDAVFAPPLQTRQWYHTGREGDETMLYGQPYQDSEAFAINATRLTYFDPDAKRDRALDEPDENARYWLYRALKGRRLRNEVYGLDGGDYASTPYSVGVARYQVRQLYAAISNSAAIAMPAVLEETSYTYERIAGDPQIGQNVTLTLDEYGVAGWRVSVGYPRRKQGGTSPYPDTLPASCWNSSYDSQQQALRLAEQRSSVWHLTAPQQWRLNLPNQQRANVLTYDSSAVPAGGLNFENLVDPAGLLGNNRARVYGGQSVVIYQTEDRVPDFLALVDHDETADLNDSCLAAYDDILDASTLTSMLTAAGYVSSPTVLAVDGAQEKPVWIVQSGFASYLGSEAFHCPRTRRKTVLTSTTTLSYDSYYCAVNSVADELGNSTAFEYDYRFVAPRRTTDINGNCHEVQRDALGRTIGSTFYGTESAKAVGFRKVADYPVNPALKVADAIAQAGQGVQQLAGIYAYDPFSWMGTVSIEQLGVDQAQASKIWQRLQALRLITAQGHIRAFASRWRADNPSHPDLSRAVMNLLATAERMPVNSAALMADRYPDDSAQQVRVSVTYADGFGRLLQSGIKAEAGAAWQRTVDGALAVDPDGKTIEVSADPRWRVSGRVEYDNKGQPVRSYQPCFVDDWQYVTDDSMRANGYVDSHFYDATGREIRVRTALDYMRRQSYFPWFSVSEDENDTWAEVAAS